MKRFLTPRLPARVLGAVLALLLLPVIVLERVLAGLTGAVLAGLEAAAGYLNDEDGL